MHGLFLATLCHPGIELLLRPAPYKHSALNYPRLSGPQTPNSPVTISPASLAHPKHVVSNKTIVQTGR